MLLDIILLVVLICISAFFSCAESAFMAVSRLQAETLAKQNIPGAKTLLNLKKRPRQFIITILIGNNLVNTLSSALATVMATSYFGSSGVGIATGVMTFILLTFGEIIPKSYATSNANKISLFMARISMIFIYLFYPLVIVFEKLTNVFLKMFGATKITPLFSESELRTLVEMGVKEKHLNMTEKEFIEGVLEFKQIHVKEIMTPKRKIFSLDENMTVQNAIIEINKREHTRVPVYSNTKENIVGIIYLKDLLEAIVENQPHVPLKNIARKPLFVDETKLISTLFNELQARHVHMAVVINKKHDMKGIVTHEDILEQIVGDIFDEKDISPTLMKRINRNKILVHGDTDIKEINKFFNIKIPLNDTIKNLNQFLETIKKREWQEGLKVRWNELTFTIRDVEEKKPVKIFVEKRDL
ncbi:MAG: CNNM domain-containing protein [Candidatus Woesearchaeota archaeon]|jgi:CBS domain containing-hemolysin-like protein